MPQDDIFEEPESSSDEDDPIVDEDTCSKFEIEHAFPVKYEIADESAVSLKKVYILSLCADKSFSRIVAGLSNNSVQVFDVSSSGGLSRPSNDTINFGNIGSVCGVCFLDETPNNLLVGNTSGVVSLYDLRTAELEYTFEETKETTKKPITAFALNPNSRIICTGTEQFMHNVHLLFFDVRKKSLMGSYWESHQDDVTDIKFNSTNPGLVCSGSTDGLINIFDVSASCEDDALISTINTESSVHKLNWHKDVYDKDIISCITHTNDLKIYDGSEGDLIANFERAQVCEAIKRKSARDCNLVTCHDMPGGGMFLLAASNYNKGEVVRSLQLQNKNLLPHADFDGNKQIIRESLYDARSNSMVTAGESGIVTLWTPSTADQPALKSGSSKLKSKTAKAHGKTPY